MVKSWELWFFFHLLIACKCVFKLVKAGVTTAYSALNVLTPLKTVHEKKIKKEMILSFIYLEIKKN